MHKNEPFCTDACNTPVCYTPVSVHPSFPPLKCIVWRAWCMEDQHKSEEPAVGQKERSGSAIMIRSKVVKLSQEGLKSGGATAKGQNSFRTSQKSSLRTFPLEWAVWAQKTETGRIRFQIVSFGVLTKFWEESSVSSFRPMICVPNWTHHFSPQSCPSLVQNSLGSLCRNSTLKTVFRPFPEKEQSRIKELHGLILHPRVCAFALLLRCWRVCEQWSANHGSSLVGDRIWPGWPKPRCCLICTTLNLILTSCSPLLAPNHRL